MSEHKSARFLGSGEDNWKTLWCAFISVIKFRLNHGFKGLPCGLMRVKRFALSLQPTRLNAAILDIRWSEPPYERPTVNRYGVDLAAETGFEAIVATEPDQSIAMDAPTSHFRRSLHCVR
ncbi:MAG: hypothetical protein GIW94_01380 [Candidatus Eremiobacteraeota bacterium]|nr:hypothetical protein [Candidatus Eremiobacteraeota bacterium]MBC5820914.1 hypothetical protein [Candidatus Eremiobacteraeota bacterium]